MKKYFDLLVESQRTFQFSSKQQLFKLLVGNTLVGIFDSIGFIPLFLLIIAIGNPGLVMSYPFVAPVLNYFSISSPVVVFFILSILIAMAFIFKAFLQILFHRQISKTTALWGNTISQKIFFNYFQADYSLLLKKSLPHMREMIGYGQTIPNSFFINFVYLFSYGLQTVFLLLVMVIALGWVALIVLVVGVIGFLFDRFYIRDRLIKMEESLLKRNTKRGFIESNAINNIKDAKLSGKEDVYIKKYNNIVHPDARDRAQMAFLSFVPSQITEVMMILLMILTFNVLAGFSQDNGFLTARIGVMVGVVFRLLPYFNRIMASWNELKSISTVVQKILIEYKDVKKYRSVPTKDSLPIDFKESIELNNVSFSYDNAGIYSIEEFDYKITKGQFIGLTGTSGGGKTTFINILAGFITPQKGRITIDNTILTRKHMRSWHKKIGMVNQDIFIAVGTIAENVAYGEELSVIKRSKAKQKRIIEALEKAQIWDFVKELPKGIFTPIGDGNRLLSGGQGQRIAIARAFYRNIELLILDEASAKLDVLTEGSFFDYLESLKGQITVVMIAHRLSTLKGCDDIIFMKAGKIKNRGTFKELEEKDEDFRLYLQRSLI